MQCPLYSKKKHFNFYLNDEKNQYFGKIKIELESNDHPAVQNFLILCLGYAESSLEQSLLVQENKENEDFLRGGFTTNGDIPNVIEGFDSNQGSVDQWEVKKGDLFQLWRTEYCYYSPFLIQLRDYYVCKKPKLGKVVEGLDLLTEKVYHSLTITKCGYVL